MAKNGAKYEILVKSLINDGEDLTKEFQILSYSELTKFSDLAKVWGYKRSKFAYHSTGSCFYVLLQRVYNRMKSEGKI